MAVLIRRGRIEKQPSPEAGTATAGAPGPVGAEALGASVVVAPQAVAGAIATSEPEAGEVLRLEPADDPAAIANRLGAASRVEVNFPSFTDGRGYSTARLLRERFGYRGELRAVGDVQRDQLFNLGRCGFDAFLLKKDDDAADALAALNDFSEAYQASVERPLPLFRRRTAEA
jgi:uncharacterized protein (DUF934 family)